MDSNFPILSDMKKMVKAKQEEYTQMFIENANCQQEMFHKQWKDWCDYVKEKGYLAAEALQTVGILPATNEPQVKSDDIPNDTNRFFRWSRKGTTQPNWRATTTSTRGDSTVRPLCYDHHFCDSPALATASHVLMGGLALFLCMAGLFVNILLIPVFNLVGIRSSATVYMTGIAICDSFLAVLLTLLVVIRNLPGAFSGQLLMYQSFSGYLLSFGWPLMQFADVLSLWIVVALLVDRFLYRRQGLRLDHLFNRTRCVRLILILTLLIALYTVPKFLKYKMVEHRVNGTSKVFVMFTHLGESVTFRWAVLWLEFCLEFVIPYSLLTGFGVVVGVSLVRQGGIFNMQSDTSLSSVSSADKIGLRECVNTRLALWIALLVMVCRFPRFLLHGFHLSTGHGNEYYPHLSLAAQFMEVLCICGKPIIYLTLGSHLRRAMLDMLCLFFRPQHMREITLAGGFGSVVEIKANGAQVPRSDTTMTLLGKDRASSASLGRQDLIYDRGQSTELRKYAISCAGSSSYHVEGGDGEKESIDSGLKGSTNSSKDSSRQPLVDADYDHFHQQPLRRIDSSDSPCYIDFHRQENDSDPKV